jgi:hypothetical protein
MFLWGMTMKWVTASSDSCLFVAAILMSSTLCAQQATTPAPAATPAPQPAAAPASISSSLGVIVFPAKNQTPAQQSTDEGYCFGWAKTQTNIDPMAPAPQQPVSPQTSPAPSTAGNGAPVKGAAGGAAAGAAIGAVAGNAGKGAAIGATTGALTGIAAKRRAQQDAAQQSKQAQANDTAQTQAAAAQQKATYNKAFSACMEGKGYTAK